MSVLRYWLWLSALRGVGVRTAARLLEEAGSPEEIYFTRSTDLDRFPWLTAGEKAALSDKELDTAARIADSCAETGAQVITLNDAAYPERLRNIPDPPVLLYASGSLPPVDDLPAVAIVGTRSCTPYGIKTAERIAYEYTLAGGLVVTGLARGVDTAAARGALRAGGRVVCVLGNGTNVIYPRENAALYQDVQTVGALISEYPPDTQPTRSAFPARNRVMSGISAGVLVIEAPEHSGALITASRALDQGRDLFAVPGNVDAEACAGSNRLLKEGAGLVTSGWDLADEYRALYPDKLKERGQRPEVPLDEKQARKLVAGEASGPVHWEKAEKESIDKQKNADYIDQVRPAAELDGDERIVAGAISRPDMPVDDIIADSGLPASKVLTALTLLEIKGYASQRSGKRFTLNVTVK